MTNKEKEAKKIAKNALEITSEENEKKPFTIETAFSLCGATPLALKNEAQAGLHWVLKLSINEILDRSFYKYSIKLSINEKPFEDRVEDAERKITELQTEAHLPNMEDKQGIKDLQDRIKKTKEELAQLIRSTDVIDFLTTVISIKYSGLSTVVEFDVPADTIALLNKNRFFFNQYKIELQPIFG